MKGLVYVLKAGEENYYKIGFTTVGVAERMRELQTGCPHKLVYIFHIRTSDSRTVEAYLHQQFVKNRLEGEWFKLNESEIAKCLCIMQSLELQMCLERIKQSNDLTGQTELPTQQEEVKEKRLSTIKRNTDNTVPLWFPDVKALILALKDTNLSLASFIKDELKVTNGDRYKIAKPLIVRIIRDTADKKLIAKFGLD